MSHRLALGMSGHGSSIVQAYMAACCGDPTFAFKGLETTRYNFSHGAKLLGNVFVCEVKIRIGARAEPMGDAEISAVY